MVMGLDYLQLTDEERGQLTVQILAPVVALAIPWFFFRSNWLAWVIGGTVAGIGGLVLGVCLGYRWGFLDGRKATVNSAESNEIVEEAPSRLERFESALAEVELFAYEKSEGLIPDGCSELNPGLGPMDFNEWREWKERGFERTGNLWFNHPGGLAPQSKDDAEERGTAELQ